MPITIVVTECWNLVFKTVWHHDIIESIAFFFLCDKSCLYSMHSPTTSQTYLVLEKGQNVFLPNFNFLFFAVFKILQFKVNNFPLTSVLPFCQHCERRLTKFWKVGNINFWLEFTWKAANLQFWPFKSVLTTLPKPFNENQKYAVSFWNFFLLLAVQAKFLRGKKPFSGEI